MLHNPAVVAGFLGNVYNTTQAPLEQHGIRNSILGVSLLITNILIIILNFLTILVISKFRHKNAIDIFVFALALADFIKGLIPVPMTTYIYMTDWYLRPDSLESNFFGWIAFATNSYAMLILTLMSIERFWCIVHPFRYKTNVTVKRVKTIALLAMTFSALHSAMPVFGVGRMIPYYAGAYSHFDYSRYSKGTISYSMFILIYGYGMIFVVMVMYSFVFYKIRDLIHRHSRMSVYQRKGTNESGLNLKTEKMFSYLTLALMVVFMIGWLPFLMVVSTAQLNQKAPNENLDLFAMRMAVITSLVNPIACSALCKPYRTGVLFYFRMLGILCGFKKPNNDIWDPWKRRGSRSTISKNERSGRRTKQTKSSFPECGQNSLTGLVYPNTTDYEKHRVPEVLERYDSFRANKKEGISTDTKDHQDKEKVENHKEITKDTTCLLVHRSLDSGIEGSPSTARPSIEKMFVSSASARLQKTNGNFVSNSTDHNHLIQESNSFFGKVQNLFSSNCEDSTNRDTDLLITHNENINISPQTYNTCKTDHAPTDRSYFDRYSARFTPEELIKALNEVLEKKSAEEKNNVEITHGNPNRRDFQKETEWKDFGLIPRTRCFSEGYENDHIKPAELKEIVQKELEDSRNMLHRIKQELKDLDTLKRSEYKPKFINGVNCERNTVCF